MRGAGGTPGGLGGFFAGAAMVVAGVYLLLTRVTVSGGYWDLWGYNAFGQLGLGDTRDRGIASGDMGDALPALQFGEASPMAKVAVGEKHACAISRTGDLFCWGKGDSGQLGTEAAFRGRVMAMFVLVFLGTTPIGGPAIGWLSERFGPRFGIWSGGLASLIAAVVALVWQLRRSGARIGVRLRPQPGLYVIPLPREGGHTVVTGLRHGEQETAGVPGGRLHAPT